MTTFSFEGSRAQLCARIAEELQRAHQRGLEGAVGLLEGSVELGDASSFDVVFVEQVGDLDSYGAREPFTDEIREGVAESFFNHWLDECLTDSEVDIDCKAQLKLF